MYEALAAVGIRARVGLEPDGYRVDLAVVAGERRIDAEYDGAAFHRDVRADAVRDERLRRAGWTVLRFSGRDIQGDLDGCMRRVAALLGGVIRGKKDSPRPRRLGTVAAARP